MLTDDTLRDANERRLRHQLKEMRELYEFSIRVSVHMGIPDAGQEVDRVVHLFHTRSSNALRSVENLLCLGSEVDGWVVCRTLMELPIDLELLLDRNPATRRQRVSDFYNWGIKCELDRREVYDSIWGDGALDELDATVVEDAKGVGSNEFHDIPSYRRWLEAKKAAFPPGFTGRPSWSGIDFKTRTVMVDAQKVAHDWLYSLGSDAAHSGPATMTELVDKRPGPLPAHRTTPLPRIASGLHLITVQKACAHFGILAEEVSAWAQRLKEPPKP